MNNQNDVDALLASPELPEIQPEAPAVEEKKKDEGVDPYQLLESLGGPNKDTLERLKAQVPNGVLQVLSPDMKKRVYLLRGLSGLEWADCRKRVPANSSDPDSDFQIMVAVKACLWTSTTRANKLTETDLRTGSAGMPSTLFQMIALLSDFIDPAMFGQISVAV